MIGPHTSHLPTAAVEAEADVLVVKPIAPSLEDVTYLPPLPAVCDRAREVSPSLNRGRYSRSNALLARADKVIPFVRRRLVSAGFSTHTGKPLLFLTNDP